MLCSSHERGGGGPAASAARLTARQARGCLGALPAQQRAQTPIGARNEHLLECVPAILERNREVRVVFCVAALVQERPANSVDLGQPGESEKQIVVFTHPQLAVESSDLSE